MPDPAKATPRKNAENTGFCAALTRTERLRTGKFVQGSGLRAQGSGLRAQGSGSRLKGEKALAARVTMCRCVQRDLQPGPLGADIAQ